MRMLAVALVAGFLAVPIGGAQPRVSDLVLEGLAGPVRSVREEVAPLVSKRNGLVEGAKQLVSVAVFDGRGDQAERTKFASGRAVERCMHSHQADGALVCESQVRSSGSVYTMVAATGETPRGAGAGWRTDRHVLKTTYDGDGMAVETVSFDEVGRQVVARTREVYAYDEKGRLVGTTRYSLDTGAIVGRVRHGYAASGVHEWMELYAGADRLERRFEYGFYTFDSRGNWTRRVEVEYASDAVRARRAVYRAISYYDDTKRVVAKTPGSAGRPRVCRDDAALAKARTSESEGMGLPGGAFLAVRYTQLQNPEKRTRPTIASDVSDDEPTLPGEDLPAVDTR
jgi:hypothetical protein